MITIAFGFIVEHGAVEWRELTGGQNGLMGIVHADALGRALEGERGVGHRRDRARRPLALRSSTAWRAGPWGTAMRAVRDSETAAASIGLNPVARQDGGLRASRRCCAGLAGGLFAPLSGFVTPSSFAFSQSILFVLVVIDRRRRLGRSAPWSARSSSCCCRSCSRASPSTGCSSSARCCWWCSGSRRRACSARWRGGSRKPGRAQGGPR